MIRAAGETATVIRTAVVRWVVGVGGVWHEGMYIMGTGNAHLGAIIFLNPSHFLVILCFLCLDSVGTLFQLYVVVQADSPQHPRRTETGLAFCLVSCDFACALIQSGILFQLHS